MSQKTTPDNWTFVFIVLLIVSCFGCGPKQMARLSHGLPTYSQDQQVTQNVFKMRIEEAYWANELDMSVSLPMGTPIGEETKALMPKVKPEAEFLVVVISITNTGNKPVGMTPLWFSLKNEQGVEYALCDRAGHHKFVGNLGPTFNPNMPVKDRIVFDVPKENYYLIVSRGTNPGGRFLVERGPDMFRWRLSPVDKL
jgi:hypothetical protein